MKDTKPSETQSESADAPKKDYTKLIFVVLSILLLFAIGLAGYFMFEYKKLNDEVEDLKKQVQNAAQQTSTAAEELDELDTVVGMEESFYVEYEKGDGGVVYLQGEFPQNAEVVYSSEGVTGGLTSIQYDSKDLLEFTIPHSGIHESVTVEQEIEGSVIEGLYLVSSSEEGGLQNYYSSDVSIEGECDTDVSPKPATPCASPRVGDESTFVAVKFVGESDLLDIANEVMESIKFVEKVSVEEESVETIAFVNQKEYSNKAFVIKYPDDWSVEEQRGGDGVATVFNPSFPVYSPKSDTIVAIVSGAGPSDEVLDHPETFGDVFGCTGDVTFKSEVSDTVYMPVEVEDSGADKVYFVCESSDGGDTYKLPSLSDSAFMYRLDDEKFEEDVLKIIKYSVRL